MEMSRLSLLGGWCEFHGLMVMVVGSSYMDISCFLNMSRISSGWTW
jgi:hypothetical protein